jgi:hypothetical protein
MEIGSIGFRKAYGSQKGKLSFWMLGVSRFCPEPSVRCAGFAHTFVFLANGDPRT